MFTFITIVSFIFFFLKDGINLFSAINRSTLDISLYFPFSLDDGTPFVNFNDEQIEFSSYFLTHYFITVFSYYITNFAYIFPRLPLELWHSFFVTSLINHVLMFLLMPTFSLALQTQFLASSVICLLFPTSLTRSSLHCKVPPASLLLCCVFSTSSPTLLHIIHALSLPLTPHISVSYILLRVFQLFTYSSATHSRVLSSTKNTIPCFPYILLLVFHLLTTLPSLHVRLLAHSPHVINKQLFTFFFFSCTSFCFASLTCPMYS